MQAFEHITRSRSRLPASFCHHPDKSGMQVSFHSKKCEIKLNNKILATGSMIGNLCFLDTVPKIHEQALLSRKMDPWHRGLAHISPSTIAEMSAKKVIRGFDAVKTLGHFKCSNCLTGKGHRSPIPRKSTTQTSQFLELVHSDVSGLLEAPSLGGSRYFVTFIDNFSKWTFVYTMKNKSETFACFKKFYKLAERQTGSKINKVDVINRTRLDLKKLKTLRTDNGSEYLPKRI